MEQLQSFIFQLNPIIIYSIIATLIVMIVIAIIRKATKTVIFLSIIFALIIFVLPISYSLKKDYNFHITNGNAYITSNNREYNISDTKKIKNISFEKSNDEKSSIIKFNYEDDVVNIEIPNYIATLIKNFYIDSNIDFSS